MNNLSQTTRTNLLLIAGFVTLGLIIFLVATMVQNTTGKSTTNKQTVVIDKTTGEEIVETEGKDVEQVGQNPDAPLLLGFSELLNYGVSVSDRDKVRQAITDYIINQKDTKPGIKISFDKSTFKQTINPDFTTDYTFSIVIDDSERNTIHIHTDGISTSSVTISAKDGKELYKKD